MKHDFAGKANFELMLAVVGSNFLLRSMLLILVRVGICMCGERAGRGTTIFLAARRRTDRRKLRSAAKFMDDIAHFPAIVGMLLAQKMRVWSVPSLVRWGTFSTLIMLSISLRIKIS